MLFTEQKVCELAGNFLLQKLSEKYKRKNLALYLDDGLAIFKNVSGPDSEKDYDLELTIQCNRKVVNFLDVTLNFENSAYRSYLKDNNKIIESNHSPSIIKLLPKSIELRLSQLLANEEIFKNSVTLCNEALAKAGYKHQMRYQQNIRQNTTTNENRKRNIIWFNPPYSANVDKSWKTLPVFIR